MKIKDLLKQDLFDYYRIEKDYRMYYMGKVRIDVLKRYVNEWKDRTKRVYIRVDDFDFVELEDWKNLIDAV